MRHWTVAGSTGTYDVTERPDAIHGGTYLYCTCASWKFRRGRGEECKHIVELRNTYDLMDIAGPQPPKVDAPIAELGRKAERAEKAEKVYVGESMKSGESAALVGTGIPTDDTYETRNGQRIHTYKRGRTLCGERWYKSGFSPCELANESGKAMLHDNTDDDRRAVAEIFGLDKCSYRKPGERAKEILQSFNAGIVSRETAYNTIDPLDGGRNDR